MKNIGFLFENFHFLVVKFSVYLNRLVFVMKRRGIPIEKPPWNYQWNLNSSNTDGSFTTDNSNSFLSP